MSEAGNWLRRALSLRMDSLRYWSTTNPSRANRMAGAMTESNGSRPNRWCAAVSPATAPGTPGGQGPRDAALGWLAVRIEVHVTRRAARGGLAVVERMHLALGGADDHEPAAADVAGFGVDHRERQPDRHCRVHRVAASAQDVPPDLARQRMTGDHHRGPALSDPRLGGEGPVRGDPRRRRRCIARVAGAAEGETESEQQRQRAAGAHADLVGGKEREQGVAPNVRRGLI